jgi:RND family efflux transporter MFP subunit
MKKLVYGGLILLLLSLAFLAGRWHTLRDPDKSASQGRRILYYVDPMNPAHTSDKPGIAPCGMKMEPIYADETPPGQAPGSASASMPVGTVKISPEKQQVIGVRTAAVEKAPVNHGIRTVGRVAPDEKRTYPLIAPVDGWIRETNDNGTGTLVKKDEQLASFYNPQFRATLQAYFLALSANDRTQTGGREALLQTPQARLGPQQYVETLESLGMSEHQIKELAETRQVTDKVFIISPTTGFILSRNVSPGQRFDKGAEWYRITDLTRVWVLADLFRNEGEYVKPGMKVKVTLPHEKKEFQAVVSKVLPQFDPNSRTLKVRLELDNPGYVLRPDMFVDVEFPVARPSALTVPAEAVLDSGLRKTVFVDRGNGYFEPRQVETGWRVGDRVEITKGLMQGEHIVVSGNFLIDSESKMKMAAAGMQAASQPQQTGQRVKDPVCAMEVDAGAAKAAGLSSEYRGKTYYFCMADCKQKFEKNPGDYAKMDVKAQGSRETTQASKGGNPTTPTPKKTSPRDSSMQGHSMESHGTTDHTPADGHSGAHQDAE